MNKKTLTAELLKMGIKVKDGMVKKSDIHAVLQATAAKVPRDAMIKKLKELGVHVAGTSEDFGQTRGGIWVSLEDGILAEYSIDSAKGIDAFYGSKINAAIEDNGWFLEPYDGGTAMLWER